MSKKNGKHYYKVLAAWRCGDEVYEDIFVMSGIDPEAWFKKHGIDCNHPNSIVGIRKEREISQSTYYRLAKENYSYAA